MRLDRAGGIAAAVALAAMIIGYGAMFTVYQTQQALVVRLGQPVQTITEPGLNFKMPFIDNVISVDKRILDFELPAQEIIASDQKRLVVSGFARYRILDPLKFYQTVGSIAEANSRLSVLSISALRRVLGEASFIQAVRDERAQLTGRMRDQLDREAASLGISVVDVRIRRANLPEQNSQAIYHRMSDHDSDVPDSAPLWTKLTYRALGIGVAGALAIIGTWIAIGSGPRAFAIAAPFGEMHTAGEAIGRTVFGLGAIVVWIYVIALTISTVRKFFGRS